MIEREIVNIDMDGVAADFDRGIEDCIVQHFPEILLLAVRKNFYISDDYPKHKEKILALSDEQGFFLSLKLVSNFLDGWQQMEEAGYRPRIVTSPITTNPFCYQEKLNWLEDKVAPSLGMRVVDEAIITRDKYLVDGIANIDDKPEIKNAALASWQHIVFDKSYNQESPAPRLHGWLDPNLLQLLDSCK